MDARTLATYDRPVPRYTSYPTAAQFHGAVGPVEHRTWLQDLARTSATFYLHIPFCARLCWYCACHTSAVNRPDSLDAYAQALRLHQWVKNLLIFLPLLLSHQIDVRAIAASLTAFLAFGLCASSVYLLNDLLDLPSDRRHPRKRQRPFASGALGLVRGALLIPALLALAGLLCLGLPAEFFGMLTLYYALTVAYSVKLKEFVLIDVIALAGLYTSRILAGAAAVSLHNSFWLLAF